MPGNGELRNQGIGEEILIHIWVHTAEPVAGEAAVDGTAPARFEGWLDLLGKLAGLVSRAGGKTREE